MYMWLPGLESTKVEESGSKPDCGFWGPPQKTRKYPKMGSSRPPGPIVVTLLDLGCPQQRPRFFAPVRP